MASVRHLLRTKDHFITTGSRWHWLVLGYLISSCTIKSIKSETKMDGIWYGANWCKDSLRSVYAKRQWWIWSVSSTLASYLINCGCNPYLERLTWFIKKSKQFNHCDITSDITALTLMLSVNGSLVHVDFHRFTPIIFHEYIMVQLDSISLWLRTNDDLLYFVIETKEGTYYNFFNENLL